MIAGPVLSGDSSGKCFILDLASKYPKSFTLYITYRRRDEHWTLLLLDQAPMLLQIEHPHPPVPDKCHKCTLNEEGVVSPLGGTPLLNHHDFYQKLCKEKQEFFESYKEESCWEYSPDLRQPPVLPSSQIGAAQKRLEDADIEFDTASASLIQLAASDSPRTEEKLRFYALNKVTLLSDDLECRFDRRQTHSVRELPREEVQKHMGQYVAVNGVKIIAADSSFAGLMGQIKKQDVRDYVIPCIGKNLMFSR